LSVAKRARASPGIARRRAPPGLLSAIIQAISVSGFRGCKDLPDLTRKAVGERGVVANAAYGYIAGSAIAKGRIVSMDLSAAKAAPDSLVLPVVEQ